MGKSNAQVWLIICFLIAGYNSYIKFAQNNYRL